MEFEIGVRGFLLPHWKSLRSESINIDHNESSGNAMSRVTAENNSQAHWLSEEGAHNLARTDIF